MFGRRLIRLRRGTQFPILPTRDVMNSQSGGLLPVAIRCALPTLGCVGSTTNGLGTLHLAFLHSKIQKNGIA